MEVAALVSGGVESAGMLGKVAPLCRRMHPLYLRFGLRWEDGELEKLGAFLKAIDCLRLAPLTVLSLPMGDVYGRHWSINGDGVPPSGTADEAVYLPGRNLLMLAKVSVWCAMNDIELIALGALKSNPFSDATDDFFSTMETAALQALGHRVKVWRPFGKLSKSDVVKLARDLPLELSHSCLEPVSLGGGNRVEHCGKCNKCEERQAAFAQAGMKDPTIYEFYVEPVGR
jgi:7-cyano-7-deazaguanine synthase